MTLWIAARPPPASLPHAARLPPPRAYRVAVGTSSPLTLSGRTTLGRRGDIPSPDAVAAVVAALDERGGRVFLTALADGPGDSDLLLPEAEVWLDGARVRAGVAYSVSPAGGVVALSPDGPRLVVSYDVADDGGGGGRAGPAGGGRAGGGGERGGAGAVGGGGGVVR